VRHGGAFGKEEKPARRRHSTRIPGI
jgi:hypothetical protein